MQGLPRLGASIQHSEQGTLTQWLGASTQHVGAGVLTQHARALTQRAGSEALMQRASTQHAGASGVDAGRGY